MALSWKRLKYSFSHAARGIKEAFESQQNFKIHVFMSGVVLLLSIFLHISMIETAFVLMSIMFVVVSELLNTATEYFADLIKQEYDINIRKVKDISAAAVLISDFISVIVGAMIFIPKIYNLIIIN